ncbi:hypothetical protein R6Q59_004274, partial [Mikania micrantha]
ITRRLGGVERVLGLLSWSTCWNYCFTSKEFNDDQVPYEHGQKYLDDKTWGMVNNHSLSAAFAPDSDSWIASGSQTTRINVAQRFKIKGKRLCLKYVDEENDLILIACDVDLKFALDTAAINNRINLLCLSDGIYDASSECVADNFILLVYSSDLKSSVVKNWLGIFVPKVESWTGLILRPGLVIEAQVFASGQSTFEGLG